MLHGSADFQTIQGWLSHQTRDGEETDTECGKARAGRGVRIGPMKRLWVVLVLGVALVTGCVEISPTPSPTPPPSPTSGPSAQPTAELGNQVDAVVVTVPPVRELDPTRDVPYEFITREQFQDDLIELTEAEIPLDVRQAEERLYKRLGLLAEDADLDALI